MNLLEKLMIAFAISIMLSCNVLALEHGTFTLSIGAPKEMQRFIGEKAGEYATDFYINDSAFTFESKTISDPGYWRESKGDIAIFFNTPSRIVEEDDLAVTEGGYLGKSETAYDKQFWEQWNEEKFGMIDICKERKDYPAHSTSGQVDEGRVYCIRWGPGLKETHAMIRINSTESREEDNYVFYDVIFDYIYDPYVPPENESGTMPISEEEEASETIEGSNETQVVEDNVTKEDQVEDTAEDNMTAAMAADMPEEEPEPEPYEEPIEPSVIEESFMEKNAMWLIGIGVFIILVVVAVILFMIKKKHEKQPLPQQPYRQQAQQSQQYQQQSQQPQQPQQHPQQGQEQQAQEKEEPEMKQPGVHI